MDMRDLKPNQSGSLLELTPEHPLALRLTPGATVTVDAGTVWLTQEGMLDDIVLGPGMRFVVPHNGVQVLSAVSEPALVRVADVHAQAHALRRRELRRLARRVRVFAACKIRDLQRSLPREPPRRRLQQHGSCC